MVPSAANDFFLVVSARFKKAFVEQAGLGGLDFRPLRGGVYSMCGLYNEVIGATPVFLLSGAEVPEDGFARTDLDFGSSDAKCAVVLCGDVAADRLYSVKFRGIHLVRETQAASS